ncbi:hypothetical protein GCM10027174_09630 [Salinifilum aidingensis]
MTSLVFIPAPRSRNATQPYPVTTSTTAETTASALRNPARHRGDNQRPLPEDDGTRTVGSAPAVPAAGRPEPVPSTGWSRWGARRGASAPLRARADVSEWGGGCTGPVSEP